ncbi:LOW QUALITY PROTEIN: cyclin-dependent kinase-like 2 [Guaruba guarouba]
MQCQCILFGQREKQWHGGPRQYPSEDSCSWIFSGDHSVPCRRSYLRECVCLQLDHKKLGPFWQQLDWKGSPEQLKVKAPLIEADNAAGIKKQLLAHFWCLFYDQQLGMRVPGSGKQDIGDTGPLFPGDSDTDQLYHITKCLGNLTPRHQESFYKNPLFAGMRLPEVKAKSLNKRYPKLPAAVLDLAMKCLQIDPHKTPSCAEFLECDFFNKDGFAERFAQELKLKIQKDARDHQLKKKTKNKKKPTKIGKRDKDQKEQERKILGVQDFSIEPKSRNAKLIKVKHSKAHAESSRFSNLSSLYDSAINPFKISSQTSLKDFSISLDYVKNAGIVIPPINQNFSCTAAGMGPLPGNLNYRVGEKSKKYLNQFLRQWKHSPAGHYSVSLTLVTNEKDILQANRRTWEFSKTDVHLPELNHLPELRGVEAWHPRYVEKENKTISESRVPSLAAIDLHTPSLASQQLSGTLMPQASEGSFPRVEH